MKATYLRIAVLLMFILPGFTLVAQERSYLTGKILDESTGTPLAGATIYIHSANVGVIADENGVFKTGVMAAGRYVVEVSHTAYKSVVQTISISGTTELNVSLTPSVVEEEGVTVTGVSAATRLRQIPQPVSIIKKDELTKLSSTNIINSIAHIAGVNAVTTGPAISKPFIRGLGYNRVITIHDGVRQEGQQWGDEHGIEIDDYSAQRIEVLKGPASLVYGSDALAGVINIQSLLPAPEGHIMANLLSEYQTNNKLRGFYGNVAGTHNGFSFQAYGSYKGAADYRNRYDGRVFNSKFYNRDFGGMLGYRGAWGSSYLSVTQFDQHAGIVEGDRDETTGEFIKATPGGDVIAGAADFDRVRPLIPYQHIQHFKVTSNNSVNIGRNKLDLILGWQQNKRREFGDPAEPAVPEAFFDLNTITYSLKWNFPYNRNWRSSAGISGMAQHNQNRAEETLIPDYHLLDGGVFFFTQYHQGKLFLSGGARVDNRHIDSKEMLDGADIKFEAFRKNFANWSGSIGLSYLATRELSLKINLARGFRAPSLAELASNGAHEGTNRYEVGDQGLRSETGLQTDAGIEVNTEHVTLGASVYYNHINHFIFYGKLVNQAGGDSILVDPNSGHDLFVYKFNGHTANLYGMEFNMDIHPHPLDWLHFENTFSFTCARFTEKIDGSDNVPLIPAARYISQLKGNFLPKGKSLRNLYVGVESDFTFNQGHAFTGFNTETNTPGYWIVNVSAGTDIVHQGKTLFSIHLSGMNLGDIAYQNHLSRLKYTDVNNATGRAGVFNPGRNFGIKVNVPLDYTWN